MSPEMLDNISQVGIGLLGVTAIYLVGKKNKWGFVVGLIAQPFWFATAIINHQWGLLFLSVVYLYMWSKGIYEWFFKKPQKPEAAPEQ